MTPNLQKEIETLKSQVAELLAWKKERTERQLTLPLDTQSVNVLNETLRTTRIDRLNVRDIFFTATTTYPTVPGQMRFENNGAVQNFRCNTTGAVYQGRIVLANP